MSAQQPARRSGASIEIIILLVAATLVAGFVAMRYRGLWGETDTHAFATASRAMLTEARLVPERYVYTNGYGFPALSTFLIHLTGVSVMQLQLFGSALLSVWLVIPAWLAYRELTGSTPGATLATAIILIQPEFLFLVLRGSHEKFTRGLMFLCIYILIRSILSRKQWSHFVALLLSFYLIIYALITFNNLLAFSFLIALALSLVLSLFVQKVAGSSPDGGTVTRWRLFYTIIIMLILAFLFTFYIYPPARHSILIAESVVDQLALLLLGPIRETSINPYQTISGAWISPLVYLTLSLANWLLLVTSFLLWLLQTVMWWSKRRWPASQRAFLLWLLYSTFGFLGALSILIDISGAIAGNLQHRYFPSFAMIAAAFVARSLVRQQLQPIFQRLGYAVAVVAIVFLSIVAVIKATNEPWLSNNWIYYSVAEKKALLWGKDNAGKEGLWVGLNERIPAAIGICCDDTFSGFPMSTGGTLRPGTRNILISDIIQNRAYQVGFDLPIEGDSLCVYDNGSAWLYHLRPVTPFQK